MGLVSLILNNTTNNKITFFVNGTTYYNHEIIYNSDILSEYTIEANNTVKYNISTDYPILHIQINNIDYCVSIGEVDITESNGKYLLTNTNGIIFGATNGICVPLTATYPMEKINYHKILSVIILLILLLVVFLKKYA